MNAEIITSVAGAALALAFLYIPGWRVRFAALQEEKKQLAMLGIMAVVCLAVAGLACFGLAPDFGLAVTCDRAGIVTLVQSFIMAIAANQGVHRLAPKPPDVRAAKRQ